MYGLSALLVGRLLLRKVIRHRALRFWSLIGPAIIILPTFGFTNYWMNEPGFTFIFEFPMVLAPSIVVPLLLFLNLLLALGVLATTGTQTRPSSGRKTYEDPEDHD
ncbi:hypothetical protein [Desulfuromonas versatilis]|uniref:hypothetical protein n=1 Tax=Desulfuromonas versatilis TaxID=2802975 RepID=UPI001C857AFA|nr:hypothetical protein [Desulfuromonas versatilis]